MMRKIRRVAALIVLLPALLAAQQAPRFEPAPCTTSVGEEKSECGFVTVPQDRSDPSAGTIKIAVKIYRSVNPNPAQDPVIFLSGGPGNPSAQLFKQMGSFDKNIKPWLDRRDVIVYDRRGGGFSEPSLECPEVVEDAFLKQELPASQRDWQREISKALGKCAQRLRKQGIKLEAYNSIEDAADVADIRRALGIKEWSLLGVSYGSRLALTILRYNPEGVRSAIIHSVDPPMWKMSSGIGAAESLFLRLFKQCAEDRACNAAYPNLERVFFETIDKYNKKPVQLKIPFTLPNTPLSGKTIDWKFTGGQVSGILYGEMYSIEGIANAPRLLYAFHSGDEKAMVEAVVRNILIAPAFINFGQLVTFSCMDSLAFETGASMEAAYKAHPKAGGLEFGRIYSFGKYFVELCESIIDMRKMDPSYQQAVVTDIPTLIVAGELDSATPLDNAILAAGTLKNSQLFMIPGVGHDPLSSGACTLGLARQFLENPMRPVDGSCINKEFPGVKFVLPK